MQSEDPRAVRIGCSGWQYRHWRGDFYPTDLPQSSWLSYYVTKFDTIEINNSFYRLPDRATFAGWARGVPEDFVFAVKASRYLTHMKKLKNPAEPIRRLFSRARALGRKLGPTLYQLPPHWKLDRSRLEKFLRRLPEGHRHAIEFRDGSWYTDEVFALLRRHHVALCLHDMAGSAIDKIVTAGFVYVRFHGTERYGGRYDERVLRSWSRWLEGQIQAGRELFVYFNNDAGGHAPRDAMRLRAALQSGVRSPSRPARQPPAAPIRREPTRRC